MIEPIDTCEVIGFLEALKTRVGQYYQQEVYSRGLTPTEANREHNNQAINISAIELTISQIGFFEQRDGERRMHASKFERAHAGS